jgi:hypothetical protein
MTFTKNQSVILSIIGCISVFMGICSDGSFLGSILLVFGGAVVCAALITPTDDDETQETSHD